MSIAASDGERRQRRSERETRGEVETWRGGETWRGEVEVMLRGAHGLDGVRVRESEGGD